VLGENTTRSMLYVAMTRGRETNSAYIYETAPEQENGLDPPPSGRHAMCRGTPQYAARLARAIIANHEQPITAHEFAADTPRAVLPERVRRIHDRRVATAQIRRATYQSWQADAQNFARAMNTARERHNSRTRDQILDDGIEM
jgi:ATP-dependent exoDNAse (exonuclease V) beta subunit